MATAAVNFGETLQKLLTQTGFLAMQWQDAVMLALACFMIWLAIVKKFEPLLLLPIAFGVLLANLPQPDWIPAALRSSLSVEELAKLPKSALMAPPVFLDAKGLLTLDPSSHIHQAGGLLYYLYQGVKLSIFPPLIFLGIGCMTDFGPLLARPVSLLLGAAAQLGIYAAFILAQSANTGCLTL